MSQDIDDDNDLRIAMELSLITEKEDAERRQNLYSKVTSYDKIDDGK